MTHPTDEELDTLVAAAMDRSIERLRKMAAYAGRPSWETVLCEELSAPISALRAQLAEAKADKERLGRELNLARYGQPDFSWQVHKEALAAANARADRAEAALAAQIQADAGLMERRADDLSDAVKWGGSKQYITSLKGGEVELRNAAKLIRNQPHDRTALDRLLADAEAKALRRAAKACDWGDIYGDNAVKCILALIPKEGEANG